MHFRCNIIKHFKSCIVIYLTIFVPFFNFIDQRFSLINTIAFNLFLLLCILFCSITTAFLDGLLSFPAKHLALRLIDKSIAVFRSIEQEFLGKTAVSATMLFGNRIDLFVNIIVHFHVQSGSRIFFSSPGVNMRASSKMLRSSIISNIILVYLHRPFFALSRFGVLNFIFGVDTFLGFGRFGADTLIFICISSILYRLQ